MINDAEFKEIEGLNWLPWVGANYGEIPDNKKVLIVGESHYLGGTEENIKQHFDQEFTRVVIKEQGIGNNHYTRIFPNLYKALFQQKDFNTEKFWNNVCYYNFVQRPMNSLSNRPKASDFYDGWKVFEELVDKLQPSVVIFIGTSSNNYFDRYTKKHNSELNSFHREDKINNTYPRVSESKDRKLYAIKHTSKFFSGDKWNKFLTNKIEKELTWLLNSSLN